MLTHLAALHTRITARKSPGCASSIPIVCQLEASFVALQLGNLLPVTLGNIIGGAVCVAGVYALAFGRPGSGNAAPAMAVN